jgi:hypothetical protein
MGKTASLANIGTIADSSLGFRNRIINGGMTIDQRNAGAEVNPVVNATYYLDRWNAVSQASGKFKIKQNAGAVTPPNGFVNYLGCTSLSAYTVGAAESFVIRQMVEGYNVSDLSWGTANAATVTLSFWVYSSLTGTFGGSLANSAQDRSYPFSYTVSSANTWEQKTVTIAGDTTGTWLTDSGVGIRVNFSLGAGSTVSNTAGAWAAGNYRSATGATSVVGTNGATFYITGVQLEKGSTATSFDYRPIGTELALCQRYLPIYNYSSGNDRICYAFSQTTTVVNCLFSYVVTPRVPPTGISVTNPTNFKFGSNANFTASAVTFNSASYTVVDFYLTISGGTALQPGNLFCSATGQIQFTGCEL